MKLIVATEERVGPYTIHKAGATYMAISHRGPHVNEFAMRYSYQGLIEYLEDMHGNLNITNYPDPIELHEKILEILKRRKTDV